MARSLERAKVPSYPKGKLEHNIAINVTHSCQCSCVLLFGINRLRFTTGTEQEPSINALRHTQTIRVLIEK